MHYTITAESGGKRILKIGQHLPKLLAIKYGDFFVKHETRCRPYNLHIILTSSA